MLAGNDFFASGWIRSVVRLHPRHNDGPLSDLFSTVVGV